MRRLVFVLIIFFGFLAGHARAGEVREIELEDGSIIFGQIVSFRDGVYTLTSKNLGTLKIEEARIRAIRSTRPPINSGITLDDLKQRMINDHEIMTMILSLRTNPYFKALLEDPAMVDAIASGDIDTLISNPNFLKLLENPTIQEIGRKVRE